MVRLPGAGVEGDVDLLFAHEPGELVRFHRVQRGDLEAAGGGAPVEVLRKGGVDVREVDLLEAVVIVELLPDHGTDSAHADD